jgi:hypothetical protein
MIQTIQIISVRNLRTSRTSALLACPLLRRLSLEVDALDLLADLLGDLLSAGG